MNDIYIHDKNLKYPANDFTHMIESEKAHDYTYDKDFEYRLRGFKHKFVQFVFKTIVLLIVQPVCYVRYALRIKGKKNYRKYKKISGSKGMISICNHTTEWDTVMVMTSRYFKFPEFPVWQEGIESKSGMFFRYAGGLAMPYNSFKGTYFAYNAMKDVVNEGKWLHVYPEAACWAFYPALREFKEGIFKLAYETKKPILPMVVKYRPNKGLYKLFKKHPNATLIIGEPIETNYSLEKNESIEDLSKRSHLAMVHLLGIESEEENAKLNKQLKRDN